MSRSASTRRSATPASPRRRGSPGVLTSQTPGLTVTQATSDYPDIAPGATATNNTTYQLDVGDEVPCGTQLDMQLAVTTGQGNFTVDIELLTCELSQTAPIQIPDIGPATPYPSTINVTGFGTNVTDIDVRLNGITHTEPDDLDLLLVGPTGQTARIMSDVGGTTDVTGVNLTLDDQAPASIDNTAALVSGTFRPTNSGAGDAFAAPAPAAERQRLSVRLQRHGPERGLEPLRRRRPRHRPGRDRGRLVAGDRDRRTTATSAALPGRLPQSRARS